MKVLNPTDRLCDLQPTAYNHTLSHSTSLPNVPLLLVSPLARTVIMSTIAQKLSNLAGTSAKAKVLAQSDNDVVIVGAIRSAITKVRGWNVHFSFACLLRGSHVL